MTIKLTIKLKNSGTKGASKSVNRPEAIDLIAKYQKLPPMFVSQKLVDYIFRSEPLAPNPTPYTLHPTPYTLHPTPYTRHPTYTLHPTPYILHPAYTLHLTPYTLHPTPNTLHPTNSEP